MQTQTAYSWPLVDILDEPAEVPLNPLLTSLCFCHHLLSLPLLRLSLCECLHVHVPLNCWVAFLQKPIEVELFLVVLLWGWLWLHWHRWIQIYHLLELAIIRAKHSFS